MPKLKVIEGPFKNKEISINKNTVIGRNFEEGISIPDNGISKKHIFIFKKDKNWYVQDLGSLNGTYVNNKKIEKFYKLKTGDKINIGTSILVFEDDKKESPGEEMLTLEEILNRANQKSKGTKKKKKLPKNLRTTVRLSKKDVYTKKLDSNKVLFKSFANTFIGKIIVISFTFLYLLLILIVSKWITYLMLR